MVAFCVEKGISQSSFYRWRRRLNGDVGRTKSRRDRETNENDRSRFLPVKVVEAIPVGGPARGIEVALRDERRIWIEPGFDEELLRRAVRVLEWC